MGILDSSSDDDSDYDSDDSSLLPKVARKKKDDTSKTGSNDDDDVSVASSNSSIDDLEAEKRICQATYGKQLNPTERNPSMVQKEESAPPPSLRQSIVNVIAGGGKRQSELRRPSVFGRPDTVGGVTEGRSRSSIMRRVSTFWMSSFKHREVRWQTDKHLEQVFLVPDLAELHEEELIDKLFLTQDEIDNIKWDCEDVVAAMDAGQEVDESRGLEHKTAEGNWVAYKARQDVTNSVLDELDRQLAEGKTQLDDEKLRQASLEETQTSLKKATDTGRKDEEAVEEYLKDTRAEIEEWEAKQAAMVPGDDSHGESLANLKRHKTILKTSSFDGRDSLSDMQSARKKSRRSSSWFGLGGGGSNQPALVEEE